MLDRLPEHLLVNILLRIEPEEEFIKALQAIPCVCHTWRRAFAADARFWVLLSETCHRTSTTSNQRRITRRQHGNVKHAFFRRHTERVEARHRRQDAFVEGVVRRLRTSDCVAWIRRRWTEEQRQEESLRSRERALALLCHPARFLEHRTILHYACWYGRNKTIKWLLSTVSKGDAKNYRKQTSGYTLVQYVLDDSDATPLLLAAWAGQAAAVRLLLENGANDDSRKQIFNQLLHQKGVPPLTSSCGGKGTKTSLEWARRKGFSSVVYLLERAGATH